MKRSTILLCAALGGWACSADPRPIAAETDASTPAEDIATERQGETDTAAGHGGVPGTEMRRRFGQLPMRYEANRGQHDARARYVGRQGALTLFATGAGPVLAIRVPEAPATAEAGQGALGPVRPGLEVEPPERSEPAPARVHGLRIALEGAREGGPIEPSEQLVTRSNYFIGDDPSQWRTDIPNYGALRYRELAPGVDMVLHGSPEGRIEYDFVVAPGTAPELSVRFEGAERVRLGERGSLEVHVGGVVLEQPAPVLYQENDGRRVAVEGGYRVTGLDRVRFEVGAYDRTRPLVIDPVLVYGTYLGGSGHNGSGHDFARGIAVDGAGAAYITGYTYSTNFPTASPHQPLSAGGGDAFVAKLTPSGDALAYATYLGGSDSDLARGIAVDGAGAAYVTGFTGSTNFPTVSPYQPASAGGSDGFIAKLTPSGDALAYATYLGGSGTDLARGIAVDVAGAAYVTGVTESTNFPTVSPYQPASAGGRDAFVAKLIPPGDALAYATYLGGSGTDDAHGIAVDGAGAAYIAGYTHSSNFPIASPYQPASAGGRDAFVAKLTPSGDALPYATYLAGSGWDSAYGIAVDGAGAAYVTGETSSSNFPTASPYQAASAGFSDVFVAKLSPAGNALAYATYLGGSDFDRAHRIAVDGAGSAYVAGRTQSTDFPTASPYQPASAGGNSDGFVAKLTPSGDALAYATYLGGSNDDSAHGIAVDGAGAAYVTGFTYSSNFPTASPYQIASAGASDGFVAKLGPHHGAPTGASCAADPECASGFCTDGVCCDARCGGGSGDCQACAIVAGAAIDGSCGPSTGNACDDGLACTTGTTCSAGACAAGVSPCSSPTSCSEAGEGGGSYTCSACPAGTFSADGTGASACTPCAAGTWSAAGATGCTAWTGCAAGTYVSTAGTPTSDRACSSCPDGTYSDAPNASTCTSLTVCTAAEYEVSPPAATSDRVCTACTVCGAGEVEVSACSATADSVCQPAGDGGGVSDDGGVSMADAGRADSGTHSESSSGGCGCAAPGRGPATDAHPAFGLLGALPLVLWRRRRRFP